MPGSLAAILTRELGPTRVLRLVVPHRAGYPPNPPHERIDFEVQAGEIAELIEPGTHLVGHSYGGMVSLVEGIWHLSPIEARVAPPPTTFRSPCVSPSRRSRSTLRPPGSASGSTRRGRSTTSRPTSGSRHGFGWWASLTSKRRWVALSPASAFAASGNGGQEGPGIAPSCRIIPS